MKKILGNIQTGKEITWWQKISQIDFGAKEVNYHGWCPAKHQTENESIFQSKHGKIPNCVSSTHRKINPLWGFWFSL